MKTLWLILILATLLFPIFSAHSQNIDYLGSTLWSGVNDVKIVGNIAYCAFFNGLVILDITNPVSPVFVSQFFIGGDWGDYNRRAGQKLSVSGNYVYFAADYEGLNIINVSDPANPELANRYPTPSHASDVFALGNYAYVACQSSSLEILDVNNPPNPVFVGHCAITSNARGVYIQGGYAYIADDLGGLQIVNIGDPANPFVIGSYRASNFALDVVVLGNYAYMAYGYDGLVIIDVTDPTNPAFAGSWSDPLNVWVDGVFVQGNYAFIASVIGEAGCLSLIDISDPTRPTLVGGRAEGGWALDVCVSGNYAYVADLESGLPVFDISNPASPISVGEYSTPPSVKDVFVRGNYAYTACNEAGIEIVDITYPSSPSVIGNWAYYNPYRGRYDAITNVFILGNYAYVIDASWCELWILNISDPQNPLISGNLRLYFGVPMEIFVRGSYAYVAMYTYGLYIIDVSDPARPALIGQYDTPGQAQGVYVAGDYAFVADTYSLQVINISDPAGPTYAGGLSSVYPSKAYVEGAYIFMSDGNYLIIADISDPTNPAFTGRCRLEGIGEDVYVAGIYAYVAEGRVSSHRAGIEVFDVMDPANPTIVDSLNAPGDGYGIYLSGENVYLADNYSFMIFHSDLTAIEGSDQLPLSFSLYQNYPNPFNASTTIGYSLAKEGPVALSVYNIVGQKIATLLEGIQPIGNHKVVWNGDDYPSGVYFIRLQAGDQSRNIKMILMK